MIGFDNRRRKKRSNGVQNIRQRTQAYYSTQ